MTSRPAAAALGLAGDVQADVGVEQQHMHNSQVDLPQRTGQTAAAAGCPSSWPCCRQPAAVLLHGLVASQRRPVDQPTTTDCSTSCAASPFHRFNQLDGAAALARYFLTTIHVKLASPARSTLPSHTARRSAVAPQPRLPGSPPSFASTLTFTCSSICLPTKQPMLPSQRHAMQPVAVLAQPLVAQLPARLARLPLAAAGHVQPGNEAMCLRWFSPMTQGAHSACR